MAEETLDKKTFSLTNEKAWGIAAAVVYMVYQGTTRLNETDAKIAKLESAPAAVQRVQDDQLRTANDVKDLKNNFEQLRKAQEEIKIGQEKINSSLEGLNAQVSAIRAALPQQGRR